MSKIVACCDCEYQDICHNFDAFFGCRDGVKKELNTYPLINEKEDSEMLIGNIVKNMLGDK